MAEIVMRIEVVGNEYQCMSRVSFSYLEYREGWSATDGNDLLNE
jgi:hypothetical protein